IVFSNYYHGYEVYIISIAIIATCLFFLGLKAQVKSNRESLWDGYKRYQLRKNLEIRYGDIPLAFGITEKHIKRALEYIIDRWFLGVETTIQTISRFLLTKLEKAYLEIRQNNRDNKKLNKINEMLTDCYKYWNRGEYEHVISTTISAFEEIEKIIGKKKKHKFYRFFLNIFKRKNKSTDSQTSISKAQKSTDTECPKLYSDVNEENKNKKEDNIESRKNEIFPSEDDWKLIFGFYILENSLRTDAAFIEISKTISNRGWGEVESEDSKNKDIEKKEQQKEGIESEDSKNKDIDKEEQKKIKLAKERKLYYGISYKQTKEYYDNLANLIREISDPYQKAFFQIMFTMEEYYYDDVSELSQADKEKVFKCLKDIYKLFGEFKYDEAFKAARKLYDWLKNKNKNKELKEPC
ncbi:MAG TPA: hypothetical protein VFK40_08995, partial [Nitrososphaeraceae archaeon]|nr:hypothetical protein [Nitrososphaeraceae archaeon]